MEEWTEDDVCSFLTHLQMSSLIPAFRANHVDGSLLVELNDQDLQELGVTQSLSRKKLLISIRKHRDEEPPSNDMGYMTLTTARVPADGGYQPLPQDAAYVDLDEVREQVQALNTHDEHPYGNISGVPPTGRHGAAADAAADEENPYMEIPAALAARMAASVPPAAAARGGEDTDYMEVPELRPLAPGAVAAAAAGAEDDGEMYSTSNFHGNVDELLTMFPGVGRENVEKCLRINQGKVQPTIDMLLALTAEDTSPPPRVSSTSAAAHAPGPARQAAAAPPRPQMPPSHFSQPHFGAQPQHAMPYHRSQSQPAAASGAYDVYSELPASQVPVWLHNVVSRQLAEDLLRLNGSTDGLFLVRRRVENPRSFALSLSHQGELFHHRISNDHGAVEFLGLSFPSLHDLIAYLSGRHPDVGWMTPLTAPLPNTYTRLDPTPAHGDRDAVDNPMFSSPQPAAPRSPRQLRREDFDLEASGVPNYPGDKKFIADVNKSPETMRMTLPFDARDKCRCLVRTTVSSVDFYDGTESTLFGALLLADLSSIEADGRALRLVADGPNAGVYYLDLDRAQDAARLITSNQKAWLESEDQRLAKLLQSDEFILQLRESDAFNQALAEEELHVNVGGQLSNPKLQRQLGYTVASDEGVVREEEDFATRVKSSRSDKTRKMLRKMASVFRRDRRPTHFSGANPAAQLDDVPPAGPARPLSSPRESAALPPLAPPAAASAAPSPLASPASNGLAAPASSGSPLASPANTAGALSVPASAHAPATSPLARSSSIDPRPARVAPPPPADQAPLRAARRRSSESSPPAVVPVASASPTGGERYVATQNYLPSLYDPSALPFREGDEIIVLTKDDSGTWIGELNGRRGHFPCTLVSPIDDDPPPPFEAWEEPAHLSRDSIDQQPRQP